MAKLSELEASVTEQIPPTNDEVDQKYMQTMQTKEAFRTWMYKVSMLPPDRQKEYLASKGLTLADFSAQGMQQAQEVEKPVDSINKEQEAQPTSVGIESVSIFEDPAAIVAAILAIPFAATVFGIGGGGTTALAPLLYGIIFGKELGAASALSGAGPAIQGIAEFIGNLSNPAGEEKILAQYGPEALARMKAVMGSEANVTLLKKLMEGIKSGEITAEKLPMKFLNKLKGILKSPPDLELRNLKAGFVNSETESLLFKAQSRRINRINHMLEIMKQSKPEEVQALIPALADEWLKYQQLATKVVTQIDKNGKTIHRLSKIEWTPDQLEEFAKFGELTELPASLNRILNPLRNEKGAIGLDIGNFEKRLDSLKKRVSLVNPEKPAAGTVENPDQFVSELFGDPHTGVNSVKLLEDLKPTQSQITKRIDLVERYLLGQDDYPIIVNSKGEIFDGHQRWLAAKLAGRKSINTIEITSGPETLRSFNIQNLGEKGSSQLMSDVSSRLYSFGHGLLGNKDETFMQRLYQAEINAQLMNPAIAIRKFVTDVAFIPFTRVSQSIAMAKKHKSMDVGVRTLISALMAYKETFPEALRIMRASIRSGNPEFEIMLAGLVPEGKDPTKFGLSRHAIYAADEFDSTDPGMVGNYLGSWYSIGSDAIMGVDQFAKTLSIRTSEFMLAFDHELDMIESAGKIVGMQKITLAEQRAHAIMNLPNKPDWLQLSQNKEMYKTTFTDSNALIKGLTYIAREYPALKILFPYIRTPLNLYKEGLKMSPLGFGMSLLDEPGSLERSTTQARAALGSLFATFIAYEVMQGNITGSGPLAPTSFNMVLKEPHTAWGYSYKHLGPFGAYIALIADATEGVANIKDATSKEEMLSAIGAAVATSLTNAPNIEGLNNLMESFDMARKSKWYGFQKIAGNTISGFIPAPIKMAEHVYDPKYYQARSIVDKVRKNIPGLGLSVSKGLGLENMIPFRKWDGTPQYFPPGVSADGTPPDSLSVALSMLSPFPEHTDTRDNLDKELERLGVEFSRPPDQIRLGPNLIPLSLEQQDRWNVLAGNEIQINGMNQRERGNNLIDSPIYTNNDDDEIKKTLLKSNHFIFEGRAENTIWQELQGQPVSLTEDFPAKPVEQAPAKPVEQAPSLGGE